MAPRVFIGDMDNNGLARLDDVDDGLKGILQGKTWEQACEQEDVLAMSFI